MLEPTSVLVVDDSAAKRYLLASWLARAGFHVIEADSGTDALALLGGQRIDLVVLDIRLPDMSGLEVCERIKSDPRYGSPPVIHVSAHAVEVMDRTEGLNRGADAYLVEPIDPDELVATARAVLRSYHARGRAQTMADRLAQLAETTVAINAAHDFGGLLCAAAAGAARIFHGPAVVVSETCDGQCLAGVVAGPGQAPAVRPWVVEDTGVPVGASLRTDSPRQWSLVSWPGHGVMVATARLRTDHAPAYVVVPSAAAVEGTSPLSQLAQATAAAIEAHRSFHQEHRIAITLQRSLLPGRLPAVPGFDLAAHYAPATAQSEIGGDFYEVTVLGDQVLVAIGDVAGHSLHAATVMAELRHAVRAYAVQDPTPRAVVRRVNLLLRTLLAGEFATICLMLVDPVTGRVRMANAGHLPPLVRDGDGVRLVEHRAPLLGLDVPRPDDLEFVLPRGATLVLYTDGLIERRDQAIDEGLAALTDRAGTVEADLGAFCARLVTDLTGPDIEDDIAVLALRRH